MTLNHFDLHLEWTHDGIQFKDTKRLWLHRNVAYHTQSFFVAYWHVHREHVYSKRQLELFLNRAGTEQLDEPYNECTKDASLFKGNKTTLTLFWTRIESIHIKIAFIIVHSYMHAQKAIVAAIQIWADLKTIAS